MDQPVNGHPTDPFPDLTGWLRALDLTRPIPPDELRGRFVPLRAYLDATLNEVPVESRHPLNGPAESIILSIPVLGYPQASHHDRVNARTRVLDGLRRFAHYAQLVRKAGALSELRRLDVDLVQVVRVVVEFHRPDCDCTLRAPDGVAGTATVDTNHFSLAITELFENSRKYCDKQRLVICVELDPAHGNGRYVRLRYTDNGPGLPPGCKVRAFEKGANWNRGVARGGTGLGLFYVAEVVRLHEGEIEEVGAEGNGVCFSIVVPRRV